MERMKPQHCHHSLLLLPAASPTLLPLPSPHPAPSAKPTFDFYFGSRQRSTWEGVEKPHSCSPATSGAGALRGGGGSWDPEEEPRDPTPGPSHPQGSGPREGWHGGQEQVWEARNGDSKTM